MALTPVQQKRLAELEALEPVQQQQQQPIQQGGLNADQQARVKQLEQLNPAAPFGEILSTPLTPQEIRQGKLREIEIASEKTQDVRNRMAGQFLAGTRNIQQMGVFDLLEAVNKSKTFSDRRKRKLAVFELKKRGISRDIVETFTKLDDPTGFLQSLKDEAFVGGTAAVASGITGFVTKSPRAAAKAAALGAGAAEVAEEGFNRIFRPERARDPFELGTDVVKSAAIEGVGDLVGGKVFAGIGKGIKLAGNKLFIGSRAIEGAEAISKELRKFGLEIKPDDIPEFFGKRLPNIQAGLDPAQKSSSKFTSFLVGSIERAFGGGRLLERK